MSHRRHEFPAKVKVAAYKRSGGHCEKCTAALMPGKFQYDHIVADALGGQPTLDNCQVWCSACHSAKTTKQDVPVIAKAKRNETKHVGAVVKKQLIRSAGFPAKPVKADRLPMPPRRSIYGASA